ncbi:MAG: caspase family protein [Burkholderiales bacterium]
MGIALLAVGLAVPVWAADKRLALVVGNARYPSAALNNPENDAHVVASTLRRLGFEVIEHVNLPVKDFRRVLREYAKRVQETEGTALFFYAGHGVQIDGRNYLLPVDINVRDEYEIKDEAVDVEELFVSRLDRARAQTRIIILDACRDNPFATKSRGVRSVGSGLVEMGARGALIAYSSAPGATAEDGPAGTNSIFTRHLVKEMLVEGLEVEQMFKNVRVKVLRDTNQRQIPWVNSSMTSNFSFNPRAGGEPAEASRREDLGRLQTSLDKRERDQKELEDKIKRLSRELEQAQAARRPAPAAVAAASAPASASKAPVEAPAKVETKVVAARVEARGKVELPPATVPSFAPPPPPPSSPPAEAASARRRPVAPDVKVTQAPPIKVAGSRKAEGSPNSERCVALLIRAQLGEELPASDLSFLQKECR